MPATLRRPLKPPVKRTANRRAMLTSDSDSSAQVTTSRRVLAIGGSTAPRTIQPDGVCILPARGIFKRGTRWLFGAFEISPTADFDPECWEKMIAYERAVTERIRAELAFERELK